MKKRFGHVTNSSSSSFIIAKNDNCTVEEIETNIRENKDDIIDIYDSFNENPEDYIIEELIEDLASKLFEIPDLKLDNWKVGSRTFSGEDEIDSAFIYEYGHKLGTENFKIQPSDW